MKVRVHFPNNEDSTVFVYKQDQLFLTMKRKFHIGSKKTGKIYSNDELIFEVSDFLLGLKIKHQSIGANVKVLGRGFYNSVFSINNADLLKIKDNIFYIFYKKYFSKIYWNSILIANVSLCKILDPDGVSLEVIFVDDVDEEKQFVSLVCYLASALNLNI